MPQSTLFAWIERFQAEPASAVQEEHEDPSSSASQRCTTGFQTAHKGSAPAEEVSKHQPTSAHSSINSWINLPPLPINARISPCVEDRIPAFRRLNASLLPIPYQDGFYKETLDDPIIASVTRIATWDSATLKLGAGDHTDKHERSIVDTSSDQTKGQLVAAIRCRMLASQPQDPLAPRPVLYISTIGTLSPFRGHSLAAHLLAEVTHTAVEEYDTSVVMAHVWEVNEEAMAWYLKRGFEIVARIEDYYRRLAPKSAAWLIKREIRPSDIIGGDRMSWPPDLRQP